MPIIFNQTIIIQFITKNMNRLRLPLFHTVLTNIGYLFFLILIISIHPSLTIITILKIRYNLWLFLTTSKYFLPPFLISFIICCHCYFWFTWFWIICIFWLWIVIFCMIWWLYLLIILTFCYNVISLWFFIDCALDLHVI